MGSRPVLTCIGVVHQLWPERVRASLAAVEPARVLVHDGRVCVKLHSGVLCIRGEPTTERRVQDLHLVVERRLRDQARSDRLWQELARNCLVDDMEYDLWNGGSGDSFDSDVLPSERAVIE